MKSKDIQEMTRAIILLGKERGWESYHKPKNVSMDLVREASEVLEHFIWETDEEILTDVTRKQKIADEIGDVLHALLLLSHVMKIDVSDAFWHKLEKVKQKYPKEKVNGKSGYQMKHS